MGAIGLIREFEDCNYLKDRKLAEIFYDPIFAKAKMEQLDRKGLT
jgi:hypothetical protein